jgi:hypothetical protein
MNENTNTQKMKYSNCTPNLDLNLTVNNLVHHCQRSDYISTFPSRNDNHTPNFPNDRVDKMPTSEQKEKVRSTIRGEQARRLEAAHHIEAGELATESQPQIPVINISCT